MKRITVIGSLSTDFVVKTTEIPISGETVFGKEFQMAFGGKGANQAVATSRLGIETSIVGMVGEDSFGTEIIDNLKQNDVSVNHVERVTHEATGSAHITLFEQDNRIIVVPGANQYLLPEKLTPKVTSSILESDLVILQHEVPQVTNEKVIDFCFKHDVPVVLNPAPAREISTKLLEKVAYLTPNEHEFNLLFPGEDLSTILKIYPNKLIVTLGSKGVIFNDGKKEVLVPSYMVKPVDTTGAGDTFNGAFSVGILRGLSIEEAIRFGNLAASISVQAFGAQGGMPTMTQLERNGNFEEKWRVE